MAVNNRTLSAGLAAIGVALMPATAASAQTASQVAGAPDAETGIAADEEELRIARQILELGMPAKTRQQVFFGTMDQMMAQMREAFSQSSPAEDAGTRAIIDTALADYRTDAQAILTKRLPDIMEGWALAYANLFTREELNDILTFVSTQSGQRFFSLSSAIATEPNFAAANQRYMNEAAALLPGLRERLMTELTQHAQSNGAATEN